jgi:hypothetical protein
MKKHTRTASAPRKVAVVGTAPNRVKAPFSDPNYEIFGIGFRNVEITRATRWYEIHRLDGFEVQWRRAAPEEKPWREILKDQTKDCELWMFWPEPLAEKVRQFPVDRIAAMFGTDFMTSTFAWVLAQIIDEMRPMGPDGLRAPAKNGDTIALYGVDMEYGSEYHKQRQGLRHFMQLARQLGIETSMLANSGVASQPIPYPFWDDDPLVKKIEFRKAVSEQARARVKNKIDFLERATTLTEGALSELKALAAAETVDIPARIAAAEKRRQSFVRQLESPKLKAAYLDGALSELDWTENYIKP